MQPSAELRVTMHLNFALSECRHMSAINPSAFAINRGTLKLDAVAVRASTKFPP